MTNTVRALAEELPEYQSSRGNEFRAIPVEDRDLLARPLVIARSQANSSNVDWESGDFRRAMRDKRDEYLYYAGQLNIDMSEARTIWLNVVYDSPTPHERREFDYI